MKIINDEQLRPYVWFTDEYRADAATIEDAGGKWLTYVTTERACPEEQSYREFENESDALEDFVERLRLGKDIRIIQQQWAEEDANRQSRQSD